MLVPDKDGDLEIQVFKYPTRGTVVADDLDPREPHDAYVAGWLIGAGIRPDRPDIFAVLAPAEENYALYPINLLRVRRA